MDVLGEAAKERFMVADDGEEHAPEPPSTLHHTKKNSSTLYFRNAIVVHGWCEALTATMDDSITRFIHESVATHG